VKGEIKSGKILAKIVKMGECEGFFLEGSVVNWRDGLSRRAEWRGSRRGGSWGIAGAGRDKEGTWGGSIFCLSVGGRGGEENIAEKLQKGGVPGRGGRGRVGGPVSVKQASLAS